MSIIYELTMAAAILTLVIGAVVMLWQSTGADYDALREYDLMMQREKHNHETANRLVERELAKQQRKDAKEKPLQS